MVRDLRPKLSVGRSDAYTVVVPLAQLSLLCIGLISNATHESIPLTTVSYKNCHALTLACAACAALTPIHVFSTRPRSFCMSELQSFMTSSALRLFRKFTMPAGRSIRAHTVPATTSRQSVSSACWGVRSRRAVKRARVMRV
jgi:hypothetical protein